MQGLQKSSILGQLFVVKGGAQHQQQQQRKWEQMW